MSQDPNYAWSGPQDPGSTVSQYNAHQFHIDQTNSQQRTATRVKIVRGPYDANGNDIPPGTAGAIGFIDIQPLVNQTDGNGNATPHGTVYKVIYHRYQSGGGAFIADPETGDIGTFVADDRDTSVVDATSAAANPGSGSTSSLSYGTYYGSTRAGAPSQWFSWTPTGFHIQDKNGNTIVGGPGGVTINGCLITPAGDVVTKKGTDLDNHVHGGVTTGGGDTGPPV